MKQHISISDLNQLSEKGKERLRKWWKPKVGDLLEGAVITSHVFSGDTFLVSTGDTEQEEWAKEWAKEWVLPLLSIGQLIEFLDENYDMFGFYRISHYVEGWLVEGTSKKEECEKELVTALWSAVKEILES